MLEKEVHQILIDNKEMQQDLANMLNIDYETMELIHEDQYINLMYADFTILSNKKIRAIVEVKGENINVTDYVRGIGQLYEYEYYKILRKYLPSLLEQEQFFSNVFRD